MSVPRRSRSKKGKDESETGGVLLERDGQRVKEGKERGKEKKEVGWDRVNNEKNVFIVKVTVSLQTKEEKTAIKGQRVEAKQ